MKTLVWVAVSYWTMGCLVAGIAATSVRHVSNSDMFSAVALWPAIAVIGIAGGPTGLPTQSETKP